MIKNSQYYHMVGIKGVGMSALACILKDQGIKLTGSDVNEVFFTDKVLKDSKIPVFSGFKEEHIGKPDLVISSAAYGKDNPEITKAKRKGIKVLTYPQMLGELTNDKKTIAICGTHGKTTTTALVGLLLEKAKYNPTVIVGSYVNDFSGNAKIGESDWFVIEACEYMRHFLNYNPYIVILTSLEMDHPDYYKDIEDIKGAFLQFIQKIPQEGFLIACYDDENVEEIAHNISPPVISYGLSQKADVYAQNINIKPNLVSFDVIAGGKRVSNFQLQIPGFHNIQNALAIVALGLKLKISKEVIKQTLASYSGVKRRFETIGEVNNIKIIDDYAHHPTEIKATLEGARKFYPKNRIWVIFQPHTFSRTKELLQEFVQSFTDADYVIIADIFSSAREKDTGNIHSKDIVSEAQKYHKNVQYMGELSDIEDYLKDKLQPGNILITMGAGSVYKVGEGVLKKLRDKRF